MSRFARCIASLTFIAIVSLPSVGFAYGLKRTDYGNQIRWTRKQVALRIDPSLVQVLGAQDVHAAAVMASESWRGLPGVPDITIEDGAPPAYDAEKRGNGIYLIENWPFDANQLAVTRVTFTQTGEVLGVDVLVNAQKQFALFAGGTTGAVSNRYDMAAVLTHEFGHVLGLDESTAHPEATMWPQIHMGEAHQRLLSQDDEDGVIEAYQAAAPSVAAHAGGCSVASLSSAQHGLDALAVLCSLGYLLAARGSRRRG